MNAVDMANILHLEQEVIQAVADYDHQIKYNDILVICNKFQEPCRWEEGVKQLQEYCGEDPHAQPLTL